METIMTKLINRKGQPLDPLLQQKQFGEFTRRPKDADIVISTTLGTASIPTAIQAWAVSGNDVLLLDVFEGVQSLNDTAHMLYFALIRCQPSAVLIGMTPFDRSAPKSVAQMRRLIYSANIKLPRNAPWRALVEAAYRTIASGAVQASPTAQLLKFLPRRPQSQEAPPPRPGQKRMLSGIFDPSLKGVISRRRNPKDGKRAVTPPAAEQEADKRRSGLAAGAARESTVFMQGNGDWTDYRKQLGLTREEDEVDLHFGKRDGSQTSYGEAMAEVAEIVESSLRRAQEEGRPYAGQSHFRFGRGGLQGNRCSSQLV
jgi:hypothetical protein